MVKNSIKKIVAISILISKGSKNILESSPEYINEKADKIFYHSLNDKDIIKLLDSKNLKLYKEYIEKWNLKGGEIGQQR